MSATNFPELNVQSIEREPPPVSGCSSPKVNCPACGEICSSQNAFSIFSGRGLKLWIRCSNCKSYFLTERYDAVEEVAHLKQVACGREDTGTELNVFKEKMFRSVIQLLTKHCPPPASLLDVGCSYGGFLMKAKEMGYSVCGVDVVPQAVDYLRAHNIPGELCHSIGELNSVSDASLDIVTCLDCHMYWPDQRAELRHAFTKLKPGGYLAMRVVDKSWLFALGLWVRRFSARTGEKLIRDAVNNHRFSMPFESFLRLLRETGFEIVHASPRGAIHSDKTRQVVKLSFAIGAILWSLGIFLAPGALLLARKPSA